MRTIVHRLEYQDNLKTKRFEFMAPYFAEHKHIFVNLTEYSFPFEKFMALFKFLPKHIDAVLIVLPQLLTDDQHAQLNQLIPTYRVDTLMHESYQLTPEHTAWDRQADKFVCLTGGPQKYNRYRLIVELHKADLLKHSVYSLQVNPTLYDTCLDLLEHDDKAYYSFKYVWLTDLVEYTKVVNIKIEYMDGSSKIIDNPNSVTLSLVSANTGNIGLETKFAVVTS